MDGAGEPAVEAEVGGGVEDEVGREGEEVNVPAVRSISAAVYECVACAVGWRTHPLRT